ncbi:MAG TPA: DUF4397 domain-containing protein [Caldilinea sp.]|nr:DUF4397 domain-containing protein [Caldilinea sp.]HRW48082.1 DUF4397 domain-containing protein [Caldilinea sp.]
MKRVTLNLLLVAALVLGVVAPVFAQDDAPDSPDAANRLFLPAITQGGSALSSDQDDDLSAPVTMVSVDAASLSRAGASAPTGRALPSWAADAKLASPISLTGADVSRLKLSPELTGDAAQNVVIRLSQSSVGETIAAAAVSGASVSSADQVAQAAAVEQQQSAVVAQLQQLDSSARVLGTTQVALNAVLANATPATLAELAKNPAVVAIRPVKNYEKDLSETVPYIGAGIVRTFGYDGSGVSVAVLDSGIDYTHAKLGGTGNVFEFANNDPTIIEPGTFPTAKVVGGYDFTGSVWPNGPEAPDPDPIDDGPEGGHGTHVADIIGGLPMPDSSRARVRVVHASPDAPAVDVWVNDALTLENVPFKAVSDYLTVPGGTYNVKVVPTGATEPVVIDADLTVEAGTDYTVIARGLLAEISPLVLVDNNSAPAAGDAHVRFVHLSPDAPAVDIAVAGGPVVIGNIAFGEASAYTPVPAGTYDLEVRLAGTNTVVLPLPGIALADGDVYTAYAFGLAGDGSLSAGLSVDNASGGEGVAPGVDLYAVKVCSSVSTSCSGVALIQGMEYVVDPNGDGDTSDHLDIVNMSLGSSYGQAYDDDLSQAVDNASAVGVLTIASAGNSADKPFVTGTPAAAPTALSVAQTAVPSSFLALLQALPPTTPANVAGQYQAVFQPWAAPLTEALEGPLQFGDGAGGNNLGCVAFAPGSLTGRIVLVDRGGCGFSVKISNIAAGGALAGIIGLVAPGEPFEGGFSTGDPTIPGYMISQADSSRLKSGLGAGVTVRLDPAVGIPLVRHMVGSSSRGPSMGNIQVKPEIGAPGASISAVAGSGVGQQPFGGTSGAAPMVSGSAALLKQAYPGRTLMELKAALVNTAETNITNKAAIGGGALAAITRIGGGEVRVDEALVSPLIAYEAETAAPSLSFTFHEVSQTKLKLSKWVAVRNYSDKEMKLRVSSDFRFADDAARGAVTVKVPRNVEVPANDWGYFEVKVEIEGDKLPNWNLNSGSLGASGDALTAMEVDGYIYMTDQSDAANRIQLPWHVLPRKAANVTLRNMKGPDVQVRNRGVATATVESYSLIGANYNLPEGPAGGQAPVPDFHYLGYATYPVPAGFCSADESFLLAFAVNTWERQTHAVAPLSIEVYLDTNRDGNDDYLVINRDVSLNNITDGRNLVWVIDLSTGAADAFFYTDHNTNSGNTVLLLCGEQIGMNAANFGQPMNLNAYATDFYFTGNVTDKFEGITVAPLGERYLGLFANGGLGFSDIGFKQNDVLTVVDTGSTTNNTEMGLVLLYRPGAPVGAEAGVVVVR